MKKDIGERSEGFGAFAALHFTRVTRAARRLFTAWRRRKESGGEEKRRISALFGLGVVEDRYHSLLGTRIGSVECPMLLEMVSGSGVPGRRTFSCILMIMWLFPRL